MKNKSIAIQLHNLSKTFVQRKKTVHAVQNLSLCVEAGQVFGFLGPNGAGKSTTIRMVMDLLRPTSGHIQIYGHSPQHAHAILKSVGALVEGANFYDFLTGRANLEVLSKTSGGQSAQQITPLLEQIGLSHHADKLVANYSTGMKQRLGIAAALLHDPDLLILDEPTNGLDPAGIKEMRTFIRDLVEQRGKTVFLSSHLLSEIEQICDRVAIIDHGRLVQEGRVADLLSTQSQILLEVSPLEQSLQLLQANWVAEKNGVSITIRATKADVPAIIQMLTTHGVAIYQVAVQRQSLEDFFMTATEDEAEVKHA